MRQLGQFDLSDTRHESSKPTRANFNLFKDFCPKSNPNYNNGVFYLKITMLSILISSFFQKPASSRLAETVTTIWVSHAIVWKASFGTIHHLTYKKWQKCQNVRFITLYIPEPQNRNWQQTKIIKAETPLNIVSLQLENENSTAASDRS